MKKIADSLEALCHFEGITGCALVEVETGMVWLHASKSFDMEKVGEAAVEFWRTQRRVAVQLEAMGELKFVHFKYAQKTIALASCDEEHGLILVCVAENQSVLWREWIQHLPPLRQAVQDYSRLSNMNTGNE